MRLLITAALITNILSSLILTSKVWAADGISSKFKMHLVQGDENGSLANSVLLEGATSILVVDTQRTTKNAERVVEVVREIGKPVTTVFITHAHPDHFLGSKVIQNAFPNAKFLSTPLVVKEIINRGETARDFVQKSLQANDLRDTVPSEVIVPDSTIGNVISFEGSALKIIEEGEGESAASAALYIPDNQVFIAGDLIYNGTHLFLAEGRSFDWQTQLNNLRKLKDIKFIYPGHGGITDLSIVDKNLRYIADFKTAVDSNSTAEAAIEKMKHLYPSFAMERFLVLGIQKAFQNKKRAEFSTGGWNIESEGRFQLGYFNSASNQDDVIKKSKKWVPITSLGLTPDGKPDVNIPVSLSLERGFTLSFNGDPAKLTYFMKFFKFPEGLIAHQSASLLINDFLLNETSLGRDLDKYVSNPENVVIKVGEIRSTNENFKIHPFQKFEVPNISDESPFSITPQEFINRGLFYATLYITPAIQNESNSEEEKILKSSDGLRSLRKELVSLYGQIFQRIGSKNGMKFMQRESCDGSLTKQCRLTIYQIPNDIFFFADARKRPRIQGPKNSFSSGLLLVKKIEYFAPPSSKNTKIIDFADIEKKWSRGSTRIFEFGSLVKLN